MHPIWSVEQQDWVELGELEVGDHLLTDDGPVEILSTRSLTTAEAVYNLEVHGHHIYQVTELGILVHNAGIKYRANHVYAIVDKAGNIVKYGISAGKISTAGRSYRAVAQLAKLRKKYGDVSTYIVKKNITRAKALSIERGLVQGYAQALKNAGKAPKNPGANLLPRFRPAMLR